MAADGTVLMEGVRIIFRNFEGKEDQYNRAGDRNFAVILTPEVAKAMADDGWNIKWLQPREEDEGEEETPYLPVSLRFDVFPPNVTLVTSNGRTKLDESTIAMLDFADIVNVVTTRDEAEDKIMGENICFDN